MCAYYTVKNNKKLIVLLIKKIHVTTMTDFGRTVIISIC
jgi:hypothetical protein